MTPGHIDRHVIDRHLIALRQALTALRRHAGVSAQQLRADSDLRWIIERGFHLCTQNALDIASHIASATGLDPATYSSSIDCLVEANVLPAPFGERFRAIAGVEGRGGSYRHLDLTDPDIDYVSVARGFGVEARRVTAPEEVGPAVKEAFASGTPYLLEFVVDGTV